MPIPILSTIKEGGLKQTQLILIQIQPDFVTFKLHYYENS